MTTVVAVCGSRRDGSYTKLALEHVLAAAERAGAETDLIDLGAVDLPLYHPDEDAQGESADLLRRVREADGVILGSPVYHGSYSSTLKNFHDYCSSDEYESTVVGLLTVAGGASYGAALEHMRSTSRNVHAWVLPQQVGIPRVYNQFEDGKLVDEDILERVEALGRLVTEHAAAMGNKQTPLATADD
jgi:azobenzene reductase